MRSELWIPGPMPCLNDIIAWRAQRWKGTYNEKKREWHDIIAGELDDQFVVAPRPRFPAGAHFHFVLREPNKRRDPDGVFAGASKFALDSLVKCEVITTDGWKGVLGLLPTWEVDKRAPGVLVRMSDTPF